MALKTTVDEVHMFHCASHPFRPHEVQAPIHVVGSEQEQGSIAAAKASAQISTLPVEAVVVIYIDIERRVRRP
jgi:hypothetical protein